MPRTVIKTWDMAVKGLGTKELTEMPKGDLQVNIQAYYSI